MAVKIVNQQDFYCPEINETITITINISEVHPQKRIPVEFECSNRYDCPLAIKKERVTYIPKKTCHFYPIFESMKNQKRPSS